MNKFQKKISILDIIKGNFLVRNYNSIKNWIFIIFITILAFICITSSHTLDNKIIYMNKLHKEIEDLKSEYNNINIEIMRIKFQSIIFKFMNEK